MIYIHDIIFTYIYCTCVIYRHTLYLAYCVVLTISYGMYIKNQDAKNILCLRFLGVKKKKGDMTDRSKAVKECLRRWHPDKFAQRYF